LTQVIFYLTSVSN